MVTPTPAPATVQGLITDALMDAGVVGNDETVEQPILNRSFRQFNRLLGTWNVKRFMIFNLKTYSVTSTGAQSYTVGNGQQLDTGQSRPDRVESALLRQPNGSGGANSGPFDWPLKVIQSRENYNMIAMKQLGTFSKALYYQTAWPIGLIYPWPIPQASIYEVHVTFKEQLLQIVNLQDPINLPPEYEDALEWVLAERFRAANRLPPDPMISKFAANGINAIRLANTQVPTMVMPDEVLNRGASGYNYRSDTP